MRCTTEANCAQTIKLDRNFHRGLQRLPKSLDTIMPVVTLSGEQASESGHRFSPRGRGYAARGYWDAYNANPAPAAHNHGPDTDLPSMSSLQISHSGLCRECSTVVESRSHSNWLWTWSRHHSRRKSPRYVRRDSRHKLEVRRHTEWRMQDIVETASCIDTWARVALMKNLQD